MTVDVDITPTYVGDLTITLNSPLGTVIILGNKPNAGGHNGNDLSVTFNGKIMQQHSQNSTSTSELQLNVSDLPAGIYFVQILINDAVLVEKFVKK